MKLWFSLCFAFLGLTIFSSAIIGEENLQEGQPVQCEDLGGGYENYTTTDYGSYENYTTTDYGGYEIIEPILELYPSEERENGRRLSFWLSKQDIVDVGFISFSDDPCQLLPCKNLSSSLVKQLASAIYSDKQKREERRIAWIGVGVGIIGALVAFLALLHSRGVDKRVRQANERIILNETRIEALDKEK